MINFRILKALLRKEIVLMKCNPVIPKIILIMPVMVMLVIPLVANLDVKNVNVAVIDNDHSQLSRRIISDIEASPSLTVVSVNSSHNKALDDIEKGEADVVLSLPVDLSKNPDLGKELIDIEVNGVNASKGMLGSRYVAGSVSNTLMEWKKENGMAVSSSQSSIIYRYNPTLNFRNYMIPALMVVLLIIICGFLPALSLVGEKEGGTMEAMNVTPVGKLTFVLSKLIPYWIVALIVVSVGMIIGWLAYGLVPKGNVIDIYLAAILFSLVMSGLGVTIANRSSTMLQSIFVMFAFIMIFQLMGGLFTPIQSMPQWAQYITYAIPPRYFIEIMRSVYLKGATIAELWMEYTLLVGFAIVLLCLSSLTYRKQA